MIDIKHLGDITKISGYTAPVVDCIIGGSPCQDLSVAGKRAGLDGERSGLYMEQIRIVKEMRAQDERNGRTGVDIRPRYMVWENVPGAFSSNKGEDFRIVLEELAKVADKDAVIPMPDNGKWTTCGCIVGDGWSVAWRVLDAQFWGVPQRRRRIALVADFGGQSAPEILFIRKGVSRDIEPGKPKGKEAPGDAGEGSGGAVPSDGRCYVFNGSNITSPINKTNPQPGDPCHTLSDDNRNWLVQPVVGINQQGGKGGANFSVDVMPPILSDSHGTPHAVAYSVENPLCIEMTSTQNTIIKNGICPTLTARMGTGGNQVNAIMDSIGINGDRAGTLDASYYKGCGERQGTEREVVCQPVTYEMKAFGLYEDSDKASTLKSRDFKDATDLITMFIDTSHADDVVRVGSVASPLQERDWRYGEMVLRHIVRRLTPLECERLQGFPDGWTDIGEWVDSKGKKHKEADSPRYKALGNSIAIPPWKWVLKRLCSHYERDVTMASLFDGIGGFPCLWEQINGKGTAVWSSEIEEFPDAVTKVRIG